MTSIPEFQTPDLCDEYPDQVRVVAPMFKHYGGITRFSGAIVTIKCFEDNSLVKHHAAQAGEGKIMVVDGEGSQRRALLGDMIAQTAVENGWLGMIIYGCVRDVDILAQLPFGVQALNAHPVKTEKRGLGSFNIPVSFGGVVFNPGDYVYADNNGIIVSSEPLLEGR